MLYIVSGYMRTGTSMMMKALSSGGLNAAYSEHRNEMNTQFGDDRYQPNGNGFYELSPEDYRNPNLPEIYDGRLIKVLIVDRLAVNAIVNSDIPYRVVFMKRHPEEIRQSFDGFWGNTRQIMRTVNNYDQVMTHAIDRWSSSAESVNVFEYRDVVDMPSSYFELLRFFDWPIDPASAVDVIDPNQCRFRLENLEVGIA